MANGETTPPGASDPRRPTAARLGIALLAATTLAAASELAIIEWFFPHARYSKLLMELAYGAALALVGVGLPATLLHLRQRKSGHEPYLAYIVVGMLAFGATYFAWWTTRPWPLLALGITFAVAGGTGGTMYRLALRTSPRRGGMAWAGLLVVSAGLWVAGRWSEVHAAEQRRSAAHRDGPSGPVVNNATDPQLQLLGDAIQRLLESGDSERFAQETAVAMADWDALLPKSAGAAVEHPLGDDPALRLRQRKRAVIGSAERLIEIARRSGLASDRVRFRVKSVTARSAGMRIYNVAPHQQATLRVVEEVKVFLAGEPADGQPATAGLRGDYLIRVGDVTGFPGGWRIQGGMRWAGFPAGVADAATQRELGLTAKVAEDRRGEKRMLTLADDELLRNLGHALVQLLQKRSVPDFVGAAMMSREEMIAFEQKLEWATREETEERFLEMTAEVAASAEAILATMTRLGIDLSGVEIGLRDAVAEEVTFGSQAYGASNGLRSDAIRFTFAVQSRGKTKAGRMVAGDYVLTTGSAMRKDGRWILLDAKSRWQELPPALMTKPERERIEFENHVIEHGTLPIGMAAPDIALVRLDTGAKVQLASYRGKVVVLEWWASWCGPCQPAMTELQELPGADSDWKSRVEVIAVSIDDELALAQAHAAKRQWNKTTNVWAGTGATSSESARSFRVNGVPTCYIIDRAGRIVFAGHPGGQPMAELVRKALRN